jgi:hypothetical protein
VRHDGLEKTLFIANKIGIPARLGISAGPVKLNDVDDDCSSALHVDGSCVL